MGEAKYLDKRLMDYDKHGDLKMNRVLVDSMWLSQHKDEFKDFWFLDSCKVCLGNKYLQFEKNGYKAIFTFPICIEETYDSANEFGKYNCGLDTLVKYNEFKLFDKNGGQVLHANLTHDCKMVISNNIVNITISEKAFNAFHDDVLKTKKNRHEIMFLHVEDSNQVSIDIKKDNCKFYDYEKGM